MSQLTQNKNFLSPTGFKFTLNRAPNLEYFCQSATLPSMNLGNVGLETPFTRIPVPGDHITFGELTITFRVDEDLQTYLEIYNWLIALGFPEGFSQYTLTPDRTSTSTDTGIVTDARLHILNSHMNPNYTVQFRDLYPISISELQFDTKETDIDYVDCTASFVYKDFVIRKST